MYYMYLLYYLSVYPATHVTFHARYYIVHFQYTKYCDLGGKLLRFCKYLVVLQRVAYFRVRV